MKEILCFGDSNTYGLIPGTSNRYAYEVRWTGRLEQRLKSEGYRVVEEGLCGRTTVFYDRHRLGRKGSDTLPVLLEAHRPLDIVVLMLGTNDCKSHYLASAERIGIGIRTLIGQIKNATDAKILLVSPIHLGDDVWNGYDKEFNQNSVTVSKGLKSVYQRIAREEKIEFLAASDYVSPSLADRQHMDETGHALLSEIITTKIKGLLN